MHARASLPPSHARSGPSCSLSRPATFAPPSAALARSSRPLRPSLAHVAQPRTCPARRSRCARARCACVLVGGSIGSYLNGSCGWSRQRALGPKGSLTGRSSPPPPRAQALTQPEAGRRGRRRRSRRLPRRFRGRLRRTASCVAAAVTTATSALPRPLVALAWSANCACGLRSLQGARSRQIYIYTISSVLRLSATLVCVIDCLQKGLVHSYVINDKPHVSHTGAPKAKRAQAIEYVI